MLQIKQIARYELPKYPRGGEYIHPPRTSAALLRDAAVLIAVATVLDSCVPPLMGKLALPKYVTELDARQAIGEVFATQGVKLKPDRTVAVRFGQSDSLVLSIDGFNDSLQVGYEYVSVDDRAMFTPGVCARLDSLNRSASPHILTVDAEVQQDGAEAHLRQVVETFLDSLKAQGVI
jgi:hypothetical protein